MITDLGIEWGLNRAMFHILSKDESLCLPQFTASKKNVALGSFPQPPIKRNTILIKFMN